MNPPYFWDAEKNLLTVYYCNTARDWDEKIRQARQALGFPADRIVTVISIPEGLRHKMPPHKKTQKK